MRIFLDESQYESLYYLIQNDPEYSEFYYKCLGPSEVRLDRIISDADSMGRFIKHKYKIKFTTIDEEDSSYYYGSLYGTKSRINMMILRL